MNTDMGIFNADVSTSYVVARAIYDIGTKPSAIMALVRREERKDKTFLPLSAVGLEDRHTVHTGRIYSPRLMQQRYYINYSTVRTFS